MGLFICKKCGVVENSVLTLCSWTQMDNPLCSECCPRQGKWHGRFPQTQIMPEGEEDIFEKDKNKEVK